MTGPAATAAVEVRPEVVFLYELLKELTDGRLRIPRFQRPFIWRRDQMTDLLDSVHKQYPIGSLLVWETDEPIPTLDRLGPFRFKPSGEQQVGYLLDGHQRLSTLAGALVARDGAELASVDDDPGRWDLAWSIESQRFQHVPAAAAADATLFPLTSLLDTLRFFTAVDGLRRELADRPNLADAAVADISRVARSFQHYRVPVIRIRQTGLSEAVEIFARLNSKGQAMAPDQMVSALMYRRTDGREFDLAADIDGLAEQLAEQDYSDIDRTTILRAILANLDEDIYRTDWTRLTSERRDELLTRMQVGVDRTRVSLDLAVGFLKGVGVTTSRLLPYSLQLVLLSAFFDRQAQASSAQLEVLRRWFWVSSFSGWFGGANSSRVNSLIDEFRHNLATAASERPVVLATFDQEARALPHPTSFDMRSARTRSLLLVMLSLEPKSLDGDPVRDLGRSLVEKGPAAVGRILQQLPQELVARPANRMFRPPEAVRGSLKPWVQHCAARGAFDVLASHGISRQAAEALLSGDDVAFLDLRQDLLIAIELEFQLREGVNTSVRQVGSAPVDTG